MRIRTPLMLLALLATAALAVLAPLSQATGSTPATTAKKKKLKCKKGYVKKTVKKKKGKKTVSVKKCVKKKATAPPAKAITTYSGKTSQGLPITVNKRLSGTVNVITKVTVNCGPNDDRTYDVSAIGVSPGTSFTVSDATAKSDGNASRPVVVKGTISNGTVTGTIEAKSSSQCAGGPPVSYQAKAQ
jgi:hypothetical protein